MNGDIFQIINWKISLDVKNKKYQQKIKEILKSIYVIYSILDKVKVRFSGIMFLNA